MLSALWKKKDSSDFFLFNASPEVIVFLDLKGRITKINKRVYEWLRIKPSDLVGKNILDLAIIPPQSKKLIKQNFGKRLRGDHIEPYDMEVFNKAGDVEVGRVTGKVIKENGVPVGSLIMIANVTVLEVEIKNKLQAVRENEIRYRGLFDNIKSATVICDFAKDKDGFTIKEVNKSFRKIEKLNKKDVIGKKLRMVFPGIKKEDLCKLVKKAWKDNESVSFQFIIKREGKEYFKEGEIYRLPTNELVVLYIDTTSSLESIEKVQESEAKFRHIFESANDAIFLMDGKNFIDCNKKTLKVYGCSKRSDIVGKTPLDFSPLKQPDGMSSQRKALKYIRRAFNGHPQRFYWQHIKKNGESFDVEVSLNSVKFGGKIFIQAVVRDTTKEREISSRLKKNEGRLQSLFENNRDALFIAESKTRKLVEVNKKALDLTGFSRKELLEMNASDLHPSDLMKVTMDGFEKQVKGEIDFVETEVLTKNKKRIPVSIGISSYDGGDGKVYVQGSFRDVSVSRKAELKLKDSEQKLRTIITNAQAIIFIIGKDGKFLLSEGKKLEVLGLKPGQVVGADALEMYKDFPLITKGIKDAVAGKQTRTVAKVGEIYFDIFYSPYKDDKGKNIGVIGMAIDVTESENAKAKLIEVDKSKSEFISMASHQLRTPLGNIRWELEGLLKNNLIKDNKNVEKSLKVIYKNDLRLIDLVNNLLNISRIEGQRVMDKPERLNIITVIKDILVESEDQIIDKKLVVHFHEAEEIMITYDKKLIREVLSNLITNAVKFNKSGGIIVIKAEKIDHKFKFQVANTGNFITKLDQEHIFEKFYRGLSTQDNTSGTGLGLHITKSYIEKWNGSILFESPANFSERSMNGQKYKGTIFSVELPVSAK
jgi:PAS domain S-box-containing protein